MRKIVFILFSFVFTFVFVAGVSAVSENAKGPVDKATGEVMWESLGVTRWAEFNAHASNDFKDVKGWFSYWDSNGDTFDVNITHVNIEGDHACLWGETVNATGSFSNRNEQTRYWYVRDGGEPEEDMIRGQWNDPGICQDPPFEVVSGNLQVQTNETD